MGNSLIVENLWDTFHARSSVAQALAATLFTWFMTALGASAVFWRRSFSQRFLDAMLGYAAGVMMAASYWSLLEPALKLSQEASLPWMPAAAGFLAGGLFLRGIDAVLPHVHLGFPTTEAEGWPTRWRRSILLVLAITIHNIPEGLAVGVAFGAASAHIPEATVSGAVALALGIGLQNLPEGTAVSVPLRREGLGRLQSFWYGQLSGAVEPVAAVFGAAMAATFLALLPYALSFAAGAMIYVVVEEVIPEAQRGGHTDVVTMACLLGFVSMMILDVALG
ncbi:ZIP family metal transporter [Desulfosoma caldarium]|uniref:ZIP family zinc transporter n=1 Tax=Desulfosoma caldarium TaxID=610254 RepID=A0A3N1VKE7_9BACT|nr:ZIP family metal transporter [Desulfosoma caldarium]ROR03286.1 ZIP family zinc transporter [Desulfosoma caldarium]